MVLLNSNMYINIKIQKITSFLLIMSFVLLPFLNFVHKAEAQTSSYSGSNPTSYSGGGGGVGSYLKMVGPAIPRLQGCKAVAENSIRDVFGKGAAVLTEAEEEAAVQATTITVNDPLLRIREEQMQLELAGLKKQQDIIASNQLCLNSVGKLIAKILIKKLTMSTIAWINTGNFGDSFWPKNRSSFFNDLAKQQIMQFNNEIKGISPFAKGFIQNTAIALKTKFAQNARYSLNELIKDTTCQQTDPQKAKDDVTCPTALTFQANFSSGGWNAWNFMTQVPANNPLGANLVFQSELSKRLNGTIQSEAQDLRDQLKEAGGYLGDYRCVAPESLKGQTKQQYNRQLAQGNPYSPSVIGPTMSGLSPYDDWNKTHLCQKWEYVTPGSAIASAATDALKIQGNAYLDINDLNDAMAAIFDTAINKFGGQLIDKGLSELNNTDNELDLSVYSDNENSGQHRSNIAAGYENNSYFERHPDFDITKDLNQALIDEQRTYVDKIIEQNKALLFDNNGKGDYIGLIPTIYQLDYCIPGPHPGWEEDSREALTSAESKIVPETLQSVDKKKFDDVVHAAETVAPLAMAGTGAIIGASIGSAVPGLGTAIGAGVGAAVGAITGVIIKSLNNHDDEKKLKAYYATQIGALTGLHINYTENVRDDIRMANLESKQAAVAVLDTMFDRYVELIHQIYNDNDMPAITKQANAEFMKITGYNEIIKNNNEEMGKLKGTIAQLIQLKTQLDNLNTTDSDYDTKIGKLNEAFARISDNIKSSEDITQAFELTKQIKDSTDYVYNNLLINCEKETNGGENTLPYGVTENGVQRMTYYPPHLHSYVYPKKTDTGPGFLSNIPFDSQGDAGDQGWYVHKPDGSPYRLEIGDLLKLDKWGTYLGLTPNNNSGSFESIIGIY